MTEPPPAEGRPAEAAATDEEARALASYRRMLAVAGGVLDAAPVDGIPPATAPELSW
jgi:hypothetical protein